MNHQPCGNYLPKSTELSKQVSLITIALHQANVHLEDVILAELNGDSPHLKLVISSILSVETQLSEAKRINDELRVMMVESGYQDLHTLEMVGQNAELLNQLVAEGLVSIDSWWRMSDIMTRKTFYGNLDHFDQGFQEARKLAAALRENFENLSGQPDIKVCWVAEENQGDNFKKPFAQLFTHWLKFQQDFLASSLVSTEVWYAAKGFGSLLEPNLEEVAA